MNQSLSLWWGLQTTPLELLSFLLSLITVVLTIRQVHWAWLFAILSSALYGLVFFDAKLYGDSALQLMFIVVSVWGWSQWLASSDRTSVLPVSFLSGQDRLFAGVAWLGIFAILYGFLHFVTDTDVALADGFLTAGSLLGQILLSRKKIENWYIWIIVDVLYVALYLYKNLILTALLYAIFVVLAVIGARAWRKLCQA
ncbi:nicotinamide mononucleotide transporter [Undibacterium seohonense]|jgi:nicotinamide mononucleotide transporter|uniref:Nicotinamide riboside transporter PnuC n=1 Tax=Undibacterium seohonense TaxID=1344950 RepID=A0ABR6X8U5_9BURK|nr:nicotinamide riboside transporter PnuC [Undibacterium seohonense]MBC3809078.1 nicotinamide mononucleotide transporter [Undibacterium seohonense]